MKFKAELSGDGVEWLKIKLAPVLERLGKEVTLLLTTAAVTVVQDQDSTGSIRVHSTFSPVRAPPGPHACLGFATLIKSAARRRRRRPRS